MSLKKRKQGGERKSSQTQMKDIHSHGQRRLCMGLKWLLCSSYWIHSQSDTHQWCIVFPEHMILVLFPPYLPLNLLHKHTKAATKQHHGCCWRSSSPLFSCNPQHAPPHHASPYFSGALRWKSISFAKQSGRLPQHRGVMESDGWPPYREPWDKA